MSDPISDKAEARVDQLVAQAKQKALRYRAMQQAVEQVSVSAASKDGTATVTVDSAGNVTDLRITDRVREMSGDQVAKAVLSALRTAQAKLPDRLGEVMAETIGDDPRTRDTIVGSYRAKFPEPEPEPGETPPVRIGRLADEPEAPPPPPARRPAPPDEDDEGFGGPVMIRE
ncbi:YbaB/EbfC family nucleoid-associated protein [Amycolatopsis sp., V23-08]|uniref:YbaB/EbfC family nucleoid-associated protein n=1 Tax=Amycolatopsis heterodermiae TaxID=3110235 RepID=A0ABU5R8G5_9PSEU|nr:YbaB/EbfC family nucleoid-associated protein [Amycolatopsis sp., V23-08]MEA5362505.1 YbaB/EbfC family nucleoid-associated protein [Amycolatopsis sp., V23-08]